MKNSYILKKSIRLLCVILMLMFVALSFCGCAQVRSMIITNGDDTIEELVVITILPNEVTSAGYSVSELKENIMINSKSQAQSMKDRLNEKIFKDLMLVRDQESVEILNSFKNGIEIIKSDWQDNTYAIGIKFKNIDVYRYYYGIKENSKIEMITEKHFFYNKVYYYSSTTYVKHRDLYDKVNNYYSQMYPELINNESNELLYTYKTDLRRQHSDADYITKQDGEYYHTWIVDPNNLEETIMLYYNVANPENWIIVSIFITLGVSVILAFVGVILNLRKKKNNNINIEITKKDDEQ